MNQIFSEVEIIVYAGTHSRNTFGTNKIIIHRNTLLLKGRRREQHAYRETHYLGVGKRGLAAGNKSAGEFYIFGFAHCNSLVEKLLHNIALAVGPAEIVVSALYVFSVPYSRVGDRLNAV